MKKVRTLDVKGAEGERVELSKDILVAEKINRHVLFEAVNVEVQNCRQGTHDTKNKAEVSGTGKKPYKQKHTGRARQGSRRNPQFRGGGVAFGVTPEKNYCIKTNKKVSKIALVSIWNRLVETEQVSILDPSFDSFSPKTKEFASLLKKLGFSDKKILLVITDEDRNLFLSSKNIPNVVIRNSNGCSVRDLMNQDHLLITTKAMEDFTAKLSSWK